MLIEKTNILFMGLLFLCTLCRTIVNTCLKDFQSQNYFIILEVKHFKDTTKHVLRKIEKSFHLKIKLWPFLPTGALLYRSLNFYNIAIECQFLTPILTLPTLLMWTPKHMEFSCGWYKTPAILSLICKLSPFKLLEKARPVAITFRENQSTN